MTRVDLNGIGMTSQRTRERLIQRLSDQGISDMAVLDVMRTTPRHLFLDEAMAHRAYEDVAPAHRLSADPLPALHRGQDDRAVAGCRPAAAGTGDRHGLGLPDRHPRASWWSEVYSVERIRPLQQKAPASALRQLKLRNVHMHHADGAMGWEERGPFDGILATAAPEQHTRGPVAASWPPDGRLVIPGGK